MNHKTLKLRILVALAMHVPVLLLLFVSWAAEAHAEAAQQRPANAMGYSDARHLLNRTGFGATHEEVTRLASLTRQAAVDRLLEQAVAAERSAPPRWVNEPVLTIAQRRSLTPEERLNELRIANERAIDLREWWVAQMLNPQAAFAEKMTLFWHNHFATSQQKVRATQLIYRQNATLRQHALGNFGTLLHAIGRDPAMLVYLDTAGSRRENPNENFAREVMELFTLGEGQYQERDVKEAARAFTGWSIDRDTGEFLFRRGAHDPGVKTVLGKSGAWDGDAVLDILLAHPATARFLVQKLWREFISPEPDAAEVERLAAGFVQSRYDIRAVMRALLLSPAFFALENRGTLVKSPIELVLGTVRTFQVETPSMRPAVAASALLGQNLLAPPNVKGWPGGNAWINSATLLGRKQVAERIFRGEDRSPMAQIERMEMLLDDNPMAARERRLRRAVERGMEGWSFDSDRWLKQFGDEPEAVEEMSRKLILPLDPVRLPAGTLKGVNWVKALATDPTYQLK
jgi:uncharacterized protein (DUF1800 family)